jgi:glycosyltransferase involved in cell wall biosynthesis
MEIPYPEFTLTFILFAIYVLVVLDQLYYYWFVYYKIAFHKPFVWKKNKEAVSVVICAKNEYTNLKKYLPVVLNQKYPDFEVVVVNDASDDETLELLEDFDREYSNLKIANITQNLNFFSGKKFALSLGIKSAKNEILLLTDADCLPASENWIQKMVNPFTEKGVGIVLGVSPYNYEKGFLNALIRFDTLKVAMQYLSWSLKKKAYMGVGRNLAYQKSLFLKANGFIAHYKVSSGDDDLLINRIATKSNTRIQIDPDSFTRSDAKANYNLWVRQKRRHLTTSKYYKPNFKFILGKYGLSQLLFYSLLVFLLINNYSLLFVIGLFALRLFSQIFILKKTMNQLRECDLLLISPILEITLLLNQLLFSLLNLIIKPNKWK